MGIKAITRDVYLEFPKRELVVCFAKDIPTGEQYVGKKYKEYDFLLEEPATYPGARFWGVSKTGVILLFPLDPSVSLIAHECFHAAYFLVQDIGAKVSDDTEEVIAYLMEHIMRITLNFHRDITTWK